MTLIINERFLPIDFQKGEEVSAKMQEDLEAKVEEIYHRIQLMDNFPSHGLLQRSCNHLLPAIKKIERNDALVFEDSGQCGGVSEWFIALYLHAKKKWPNISTPKLLIAITKEFESGVDIQGALLQKYRIDHSIHTQMLEALSLHFDREKDIESNPNVDRTFMQDLESDVEFGVELLKHGIGAFEDGVYFMIAKGAKNLPGHGMVVVKEDKNYYFFDPNVGLIGTNVQDAINEEDLCLFFAISGNYSPRTMARQFFRKCLDALRDGLGGEKGGRIHHLVTKFQEEGLFSSSYFLNAWDVAALINGLESSNIFHTEPEQELITMNLCIEPGFKMLELYKNRGVLFRKYALNTRQ